MLALSCLFLFINSILRSSSIIIFVRNRCQSTQHYSETVPGCISPVHSVCIRTRAGAYIQQLSLQCHHNLRDPDPGRSSCVCRGFAWDGNWRPHLCKIQYPQESTCMASSTKRFE